MTWDVLVHIINNPHITAIEIGNRMGISDRMVRKHIALLRKADVIGRIGSNKTGYWKLIDENNQR